MAGTFMEKKYFGRQDGYGAFSVSKSSEKMIQYIRDQKHHHRKISFQEEFIDLIVKHFARKLEVKNK